MPDTRVEETVNQLNDITNLMAVAAKGFDSATTEHHAALEEIASSEQRMKEIQAEAESMQLTSLVAATEANAARELILRHTKNEEIKRYAYQEALDILNDARRMVEETKQELDMAEQTRIDEESKASVVYIKEISAKVTFEKHLAMAELEAAVSRITLGTAERKLAQSKIAIAEVQLNLLDAPNVLEHWPSIQASTSFNGGGLSLCLN